MSTNKPDGTSTTSINDDFISQSFIDDFNSATITSTDANERVIEEAGILMRTRFIQFLTDDFKIKLKDIPTVRKHDGVYSFDDVDGAFEELWKQFQKYDFSKYGYSYEHNLEGFRVGLKMGTDKDLYKVIESYGSQSN